jgi:hypothetical protein
MTFMIKLNYVIFLNYYRYHCVRVVSGVRVGIRASYDTSQTLIVALVFH